VLPACSQEAQAPLGSPPSGEAVTGDALVLRGGSSVTFSTTGIVAQVPNLLCGGFPIRKADEHEAADWKSAIQQVGNLRYVCVFAPACT